MKKRKEQAPGMITASEMGKRRWANVGNAERTAYGRMLAEARVASQTEAEREEAGRIAAAARWAGHKAKQKLTCEQCGRVTLRVGCKRCGRRICKVCAPDHRTRPGRFAPQCVPVRPSRAKWARVYGQ